MIANSSSLPINCEIGSKGQALKSEKGNGDLFSTTLKSMNPVQEKSFQGLSEPAQAESSRKETYLESLRKALLGKGKSLNEISLNNKDISLLKKFLCQCGFSQQDAENLLKELLQNNPHGEINLSQFFNKITELALLKRKIYQPITLDPSAIPYIESALRDLGLTPKEVEHVLSGARVEGGGLDLNRFVINLKRISNKGMLLQNKVKLDQFVKAIEEVVNRSAEFKGLTPENQVKATIDQILEKVVIANEKNGPQSPFPSKEAKLFTDLDAVQGLKMGAKEKGNVVKSETRMMNIPQNISGSTFSESINTGKQNAESVRSFLPGYLIDQVGKQISRSILRGDRVIRLQLKPPELGVLKVEMDMKNNILKLGMITENSSVKELLLSNVHELRETLAQQGVKLERLDVNINYNFGQSLANSKEGLKKGQGQDLNGMPFMADSDTEDPALDFQNMPGDRLLDLVA